VPLEPRPLQPSAQRLWQKILDDPDDLQTRAVFADQLMDAGDPLGEHIQLCCALEEMDEDDPRRAETEASAAALRRRNIVPWTRAIAAAAAARPAKQRWKPSERSFAMHRGLVEELRCETGWLDGLGSAARVAPIRRLRVRSYDESDPLAGWSEKLAEMPELARIRCLELAAPINEEQALALLASPNLVRLERLALNDVATPRIARALAASPACAGLQELSLIGEPGIGVEGAQALAALPLRSLTLHRQQIGAEGLAAISSVATLRALELDDAIGAEGGRTLATAVSLSKLRELRLSNGELGVKGLAALAGSTTLGGLRVLEIDLGNGFNPKALAAMLEAWSLTGLRELETSGPVRAEGAALIAKSGKLDALESLALSGASLGDDGAAALARWAPPRLASVCLAGGGIGKGGMAALAKGPLLAHVRDLNLVRNKCGSEGGEALAAGRWLAGLRSLRLFYNWMGVKGLRAILERTPQAEELYLGENNYGPEVFRVGARGLLPRLQALTHGDKGDQKALEAYLASGHAQSLGDLHLHTTPIRAETARLLARLPELENLHFQFCGIDDDARRALEDRFAGLMTFWG
jgi:uncharacterized protein (TIGR02996 family)